MIVLVSSEDASKEVKTKANEKPFSLLSTKISEKCFLLNANDAIKYTCLSLTDRDNIMLANNDSIESISIVNSAIEKIPVKILKLASLKELKVDYAGLKKIEKNTEPSNMTNLSLAGNQLTLENDTTFEGFENLKKLSLASNKIENVDETKFAMLEHLEGLDLSDNQIATVKFKFDKNSNLKFVNLNRNLIVDLTADSFKGTNLRAIHLKDNRMRKVEKDAFSDNAELRIIDLSRNEIFFPTNKSEEVYERIDKLEEKCDKRNLTDSEGKVKTLWSKMTNYKNLTRAWQSCELQKIRRQDEMNLNETILESNKAVVKIYKEQFMKNAAKMSQINQDNHHNYLITRTVMIGIGTMVCLFLLFLTKRKKGPVTRSAKQKKQQRVQFSLSTKEGND